MRNSRLRRRDVMRAGGILLADLALPPIVPAAAAATVEIHMRSNASGSVVGFDPVGVLIEPGQTVRWVCDANVHTATAYHPKYGHHSLRIPQQATPWNSDFLLPGQHFDVRLTVGGVYDYFCMPHEMAGMVGRIIVRGPGGPGTLPFDYFHATHPDWVPVPPAAQAAFPGIQEIMNRKVVASTLRF